MRILKRKLTYNTQGVEDTKEERTASGCLSSQSCCFGRGSSYDMIKEQGWRGLIRMEGDTTSSVPITAYVSLKVPCCGCWWPFLHRSHRLATFHFDGESSSVSHTSNSASFDVQRLIKSREKIDTSLHVKVCVLTQREKWVSRIGLDVFLDELLRPGPTAFTFKGREGETFITLLLSQQHDTLHEEIQLKTDEHSNSQDNADVITHYDRSNEEHQEQEAEIWVHRSIHVAPRFRERLAGPDECFLEYLRLHFSVLINLENSRKKLHIKGLKKHTEECNLYVRDLLAKWRTDTEQMDVSDPSLLRLIH